MHLSFLSFVSSPWQNVAEENKPQEHSSSSWSRDHPMMAVPPAAATANAPTPSDQDPSIHPSIVRTIHSDSLWSTTITFTPTAILTWPHMELEPRCLKLRLEHGFGDLELLSGPINTRTHPLEECCDGHEAAGFGKFPSFGSSERNALASAAAGRLLPLLLPPSKLSSSLLLCRSRRQSAVSGRVGSVSVPPEWMTGTSVWL